MASINKRVKSTAIREGLRLFEGLCLLFLPNVPGAMFIQEGTFIPDSRVCEVYCPMEASLNYNMAPETRNQEGGGGQFIPPSTTV